MSKTSLRSSSAPVRHTPIRGGPIKRKKRTPSEFARIYGSKERVAWVQSLPSVVSGERPCVNAHVRNGGAGRKADARWIVPLTDQEHQNYHVVGKRFFEKWAGIDLNAAAERVENLWLAHLRQTGRTRREETNA